jgi:hypothetical protein
MKYQLYQNGVGAELVGVRCLASPLPNHPPPCSKWSTSLATRLGSGVDRAGVGSSVYRRGVVPSDVGRNGKPRTLTVNYPQPCHCRFPQGCRQTQWQSSSRTKTMGNGACI